MGCAFGFFFIFHQLGHDPVLIMVGKKGREVLILENIQCLLECLIDILALTIVKTANNIAAQIEFKGQIHLIRIIIAQYVAMSPDFTNGECLGIYRFVMLVELA